MASTINNTGHEPSTGQNPRTGNDPVRGSAALSPADQVRRTGLRRMRLVALSLLLLAALIYIVSTPYVDVTWVGFVNAAAEAAMVGACADWFAVTALFRHPLGIPIPHTALIRRRKADLGRSLADFVANYFLTRDVVTERVAGAQLGIKLGEWLQASDHRRLVLQIGADVSVNALGRLDDDDVRGLLDDVLLPRLRQEQLSPAMGTLLAGLVNDGAHHKVVDIAAREAHDWLLANPELFAEVVGRQAPRWSPAWLDRAVVQHAYNQALAWSRDVRDLRDHPTRTAIDDLLATLAEDLQHDPQVRARAEALKERVLAHRQTSDAVVALWNSVRASAVTALRDPDSELWRRADGWLAEFGVRLLDDPDLRAQLEQRAASAAAFLAERYATQVASLISWTVDRWDAGEASDRIELFVGRDLQFIRINGTIVGALVGMLIHAITLLAQ